LADEEDNDEDSWQRPEMDEDADLRKVLNLVNGNWRKQSSQGAVNVNFGSDDEGEDEDEEEAYIERRRARQVITKPNNETFVPFSLYQEEEHQNYWDNDADEAAERKHLETVSRRTLRLEMEKELSQSQSASNSIIDDEASQGILRLVEKTNVKKSKEPEKSSSSQVENSDSQAPTALTVSSFLKNNRKKLKELANTYNPTSSSSVSRFIYTKDNSNDGHSKDEAPANSKVAQKEKQQLTKSNSPSMNGSTKGGRLFSFLSQSKFTSK